MHRQFLFLFAFYEYLIGSLGVKPAAIGNPVPRRFGMSVVSVTAITDSVSAASYDDKCTSRPSAFSGLSG